MTDNTEHVRVLERIAIDYPARACPEETAAFTAAIAAIAAMKATEWQPIESAPVGVEIEILGWDGRSVDKTWVGWHEEETPVYVRADYVSWRPTHWMPLPQPPKESERWTL